MSIDYEVLFRDPFGNLQKVVSNFATLDWMRVVNKVGGMKLTLPDMWDSRLNTSTFDTFSQIDAQIEIWRQVDGGKPEIIGETVWFNRMPARVLDPNTGARTIEITAVDAIELLSRRVLLGTIYNYQSTLIYFDDLMKTVVTDVFVNNPSGWGGLIRALSSSIFNVQANVSKGYHGNDYFGEGADALTVLQGIADASATHGSYTAFDIVYVSPNQLEFRTYIGQRGNDHRQATGAQPVLIDPDAGNLAAATVALDYTTEYNAVLGVGYRPEMPTLHFVSYDSARIGLSPWNRREKYLNTGQDNLPGVKINTNRELRNGRPKRTSSGQIIPTPGFQYGVHFVWGDMVTVNYANTHFDARLDAVQGHIDNGPEQLTATVKADELLDSVDLPSA